MSMSKKVIDQDTSDRVLDRNQMLMAQLLFTEKPDPADPNALKSALERIVGVVENISDKPDMPMFSVPKYKAVFKDALIQPVRTVLDINCGEFAAGNRK